MSITDELREWAKTLTRWWYDPVKDEYTYTTGAMPPSIDAIRLDSNIIAIADRIDAVHEGELLETSNNILRDVSREWVRLPKDADGEYIHVGDVMEWCDSGDTLEVIGIGDDTLFYIDPEGDRTYAEWTSARNKRHHHAPTVEDVLTEFAAKLIERGELTNGASQTIAEYAAKLRLAEGEDA